MEPFRVRLNCIDHYQATASELDPPLPFRDGATENDFRPKVPVIRVFGATETGQKISVHVHGAFPYLYIEYNGSLETDAVNSAIRTLHLSIDHALAVSYRRNAHDKKFAYVAHITLVKGIPFYGYHVGYRTFFKIYLLNPFYMTRLADLLHQGAVMKRPLQPYESHLQYIPQWMCDYNLYGCGYMNCRNVKFRAPVPDYLELSNLNHRWHDRSIEPESIIDDPALQKQSHCALEVDICVQDILNRAEIKERHLHHDFTELLRPAALSERLVPSVAGLWQDETERRKKRMGIKDPKSTPFGPEDLISMSADPRNQSKGGWVHEEEFRQLALKIADDERADDNGRDTSFETFLGPDADKGDIKTALSSVQDFYPDRIVNSSMRPPHVTSYGTGHPSAHISVDENLASQISEDSASDGQLSENSMNSGGISKGLRQSGQDTPGVDPGESFYEGVFDEVPQFDNAEVQEDTNIGYSVSEPGQLGHKTKCSPGNANSDCSQARGECLANLKRSCTELSGDASLKKKPRFWINAGGRGAEENLTSSNCHVQTLSHPSQPEIGMEPAAYSSTSSSQRTIRPPKAMPLVHNSRLNFPVVKDPNDPMTILRFSQDDGSHLLKKATSSQGPQSSQPLGSVNSANQGVGSEDSSLHLSAPSSARKDVQLLDPHVLELASSVYGAFGFRRDSILYLPKLAGPSSNDVSTTIGYSGRPSVIYQQAFYGDESDVPEKPRQYAGREFRLGSDTIHFLPDFDVSGNTLAFGEQQACALLDREKQESLDRNLRETCTARVWEFAGAPPSRAEVVEWFNQMEASICSAKARTSTPMKPNSGSIKTMEALSQIEGPTQQNPFGFKYSQKAQKTSVEHQSQYMSIMSLEVHVNTRGKLSPNPDEDEISCVFWGLQSEDEDIEANSYLPNVHVGMIHQGEEDRSEVKFSKALNIEVEHETTELDLINRLIDIVRHHDPDIITGYEVHNGSWGYVIERARKKYDFDLCAELSRVKSQSKSKFGKDDDRWGFEHASSVQMTGRHMINIWRAMRGEITLLQYSMENVVFHLLQRRIPHYSAKNLTEWYTSGKPRNILKVIEYFTSRVQLNLEIIGANELIPRTSEQARLLGIDFYSVFARGSQFKVESLMFRIAKPENFLLVSPSRKQVGQQNALECLPLVMEPQSDFYTSPLLVLDFQSLYPSVMIAYNYCYSTFLGRAVQWRGRDKMGFMDYNRQPRLLELLKDKINIAPNGMIYAKQEVRQSLLAKMLTEILETRIMVKTGMKADKDDKILQRLLNNRQLALKLIANVTYGYTSASFSGRMPCSEIADSIVQSGRETLEKAIAFIHSVERWGAEVVYGDTDSLFVYLKGRTRDQAFDIGEEIAQAVTDMNPRPIKLKFEKVYHPCVLLAKKRYVGFKYEHRNQTEPEFDAKGIETVRRDGTPAEQKIEEKALKLLFRTSDLSQVKSYFQRQCSKIMQGRVSIQDFCFAREVRLGTYSDRGTLPAGALLSTKRMLEDPRLEPQYGERVPYVVVTGAPGSRLIDRCVAPETLLHDAQLDLDAEYYITKNLIPPLERIFNLVGANVRQWYDEMPKVQRVRRVDATSSASTCAHGDSVIAKKTLESYMRSSSCMVCRAKLMDAAVPLCSECLQQPQLALLNVMSKLQESEKRVKALEKVCRSCMGVPPGDTVACDSMDCPVFYSRTRATAGLRHTKAVLDPVRQLLEQTGDAGFSW